MFSKIFVMSALSNIGTSTVSGIIAHMLANRGIDTSLYYTDQKNNLAEYFGLPDVDQQPSNISIIGSSMSETSVQKKVVLDYSHSIEGVDKLHILNIGSETIDEYSRNVILKLLLQKPVSQVSIYDIAQGLDDPLIQEQIENVDAVFIVTNMSQEGIDSFNNWVASELLPKDKTFPIVNFYNENVSPIQQFAEYLGLLPSQVMKVHYNPWIVHCTLMKSLYELYPQIEKRDPRVAQLYGDFDRIYQNIVDYGQTSRFNFNLEDTIAKAKHKFNL